MNIDITQINKFSIIDTCSIQNILSSNIFHSAIISNGFSFCVTKFVEYEMLYKQSSVPSDAENTIKNRYKQEVAKGKYQCHSLSIEDLQEIEILESRKKLGRGELSIIAFAKKISQGIMTDDQAARKLGKSVLGKDKIQTTPQLLGWLFYQRILIDSELDQICSEHTSNKRPLEKFFREVYLESMRIKFMCTSNP